jgi:periplasmic protein TonB
MNKKNIAKVICVIALAAWAGGKFTYTKSGNKVLAKAFPAKLLASPETCTTPDWPKEARRYEVEGITLLHFKIGEDGNIEDAKVVESSSWKMLDDAALRSLVKCQFKAGLAEAERDMVFPIQFVWTLAGPPSVRPQLIPDTCAVSRQFSTFQTFDRHATDKDGVLMRFLVNQYGEPYGVKPEAGPGDAALAEAAVEFVKGCKFAVDPSLHGERTDTVFGRALVSR